MSWNLHFELKTRTGAAVPERVRRIDQPRNPSPHIVGEFGHNPLFATALLIGRSAFLSGAEKHRLDGRGEELLVDSQPLTVLTFDDLRSKVDDLRLLTK